MIISSWLQLQFKSDLNMWYYGEDIYDCNYFVLGHCDKSNVLNRREKDEEETVEEEDENSFLEF